DFRIADERLDEAGALPLPAREHVRIARAKLGEADAGKPGLRPLARQRARDAGGLEPNCHVLQRRLPREQRLRLEEITGLAVEAGEWRAEDLDPASGRRDEPGGDVEQSGLAAAGRADDGDKLPVRHRKRGAIDRGVAAASGKAKTDRHRRERDGGRHGGEPVSADAADQFLLRSTNARCLIHGIIARSLAPISSMGCVAILARMALNDVWLTRFS